ncbi:uncharacterized protein [Watersipora subatra]|uniref:uncharacterized protein n=1 Tax=Watersipora subatra TaxID=2589382 RepID=UPI00355AEF54
MLRDLAKVWSPSKYSVICSKHFIDGAPTIMNPLPTLHMGYSLCSIPPQGRVPNALVATDKHFPIIDDGNKSDASGEDWLEVTGSASHCDRQDSPIEIAPAEPEFTTPFISRCLRDQVMADREFTIKADRGFTIKELLMMRGAELVMPPGARGKSQMSSDNVAKTKKIANVRIHVERVIRKVKQLRILAQTIPINLLPMCNDIVTVCCKITNMTGPIVKSWNEVAAERNISMGSC